MAQPTDTTTGPDGDDGAAGPAAPSRSLRRSERANLALYALLVVVLLLALAMGWLFIRQAAAREDQASARDDEARANRAQTQCIADWADRYTARAELITRAQKERNKAQDSFVLGLAAARTRAESTALFHTYFDAVKKYNDTQAKNPIPPSPSLVC